jgi:hypothetical protein
LSRKGKTIQIFWKYRGPARSAPHPIFLIHFRNQLIEGVEMTAELIAQLATLFLILGAGPIVVVLLYARGGNL